MESQRRVWEREYGRRGTKWSRRNNPFPPGLKGKVVLELGAGDGKTLANILKEEPLRVVALDFSSAALWRCRGGLDLGTPANLVKADVLSLPFPDGAFDVVVAHYVLNNLLLEGRQTAVSEAWRVLRDGGTVLFQDFAVGDFRQESSKRTGIPEANTVLKKKGLICHYFGEDEVAGLFSSFAGIECSTKSRQPIRNRPQLVRKTMTASVRK